MKQTIRVNPEGLLRANRELKKNYGTKKALFNKLKEKQDQELYVGSSTISNFFNQKKIEVDAFKRICIALGLGEEWKEMSDFEDSDFEDSDSPVPQTVNPTLETQDNIDRLVQEKYEKVKTYYEKCYGTLKVLGMHKPRNIESVYTLVYFYIYAIRSFEFIDPLEQISNKVNSREFQFQYKDKQERITFVKNQQYLMVLGEAGTGKSTFLRKVGLEALKKDDCIPVLIEMKKIQDKNINLEKFIAEVFRICEVSEPEQFTSQALKSGKLLILLDGLDEVPKNFLTKAISEIETFVNKYDKNRFIVSCRTAAYHSTLHRFYDVEIAEFDDDQIQQFIYNWFNCEADEQANKADKFWELLQKPENSAVKMLAYTPLFLTYLCLIYDRFQNFLDNRSRLVKKVVRLLLEEWASQKLIDQDEIYPELHLEEQENLLSKIAYTSFESDRRLLNEDEIVQEIKTFLATKFNAPKYLNGRAVLTAITVQQGIFVERADKVFSFPYLPIHEYFTAKYIVDHNQLKKLVTEHLTNARWKEVFLYVSGLLDGGADDLLLLMEEEAQKHINIAKLQTLLNWAEQATTGSAGDFKPVEKRAVAIRIAMAIAHGDAYANTYADADACTYANTYADAYADACTNAYGNANTYAYIGAHPNAYVYINAIAENIARAINYTREFGELKIFNNVNLTMLIDEFRELETQIPDVKQPLEKRHIFFRRLHQTLLNAFKLSSDMIDLSSLEAKSLKNYLYANDLIIQCKKASLRVSPQTWEAIETRMLLVQSN
jgi:hypothetical protein